MGGGGAVLFADGCADAGLGDQFLLWKEQVDLQGRQRLELVEQVEFTAGVVAEVADAAADHCRRAPTGACGICFLGPPIEHLRDQGVATTS